MKKNVQKQVFACAAWIALMISPLCFAYDGPIEMTHEEIKAHLQIDVHGKPFATYVYHDAEITRPYFCDVYTPDGIQITRNHPPVEGVDRTDHATYHPGLWLTFGDISGSDYWRNRARTEPVEFVENPQVKADQASFAVRNRYLSEDGSEIVCEETCRYTLHVLPEGYLLIWDSRFFSDFDDFYFGDQEEMGLGVRVATPISVVKGGEIVNDLGKRNEEQVWGQQAAWCDYRGAIDGKNVGVTLLTSPDNFRASWFHARDYGLLVANPFGLNAFTKGEKSKIAVDAGKELRLVFGVFVHGHAGDPDGNVPQIYAKFLELIKQ